MNPNKKEKIKLNKEDLPRLNELEKIIGIEFRNKLLLKFALIHKSYVNESKLSMILSNERLEFLGDAVLELVVSDYLYKSLKDIPEGKLTSLRAALVRTESLYDAALAIGVGKFLYLSRGEENTGGRERSYILANTIESIIGAIYLDKGIGASRKFILKFLIPKIDSILSSNSDVDPKSLLQEYTQEVFKVAPFYELISAIGPDHHKKFTMKVKINDKYFEEGFGFSKQDAEQDAAKKTLDRIKSQKV